jgi:anaerobic ribonucleoside-triphosphate reductase activating protein
MLNGEGLRVVLWVSHCEHNCKYCHNPQTHNKNSGILFDESAKKELFKELSKDYISGITLSGGDPLSSLNRIEILNLIKEIKNTFPNKNIWLYTGYEWENIKNLKGIENIDVIIDGKYIDSLKSPSLSWVGSSNQKIIYVQESIKQNKVIEFIK